MRVNVPGTPQTLSLMNGMVVVGTDLGLLIASRTQPDALTSVPVLASGSEPDTTGKISLLARRASGGLLAYAQNGLFHGADGSLLLSPFSQTIAGMSIASLDAFGGGDAEELWLIADGSAAHAGGGQFMTIQLSGITDAPDVAVGIDAARALIAVAGTVYLVDLGNLQATVIAEHLGRVNGFDRAEDGTAFLATASGLLARDPSGAVSLRTLDAPGSAGQSVLGVSASYGVVLALTSQAIIQVQASSSIELAQVTSPTRNHGLTRDNSGDTWVVDGDKLLRIETGQTISFAANVKPFIEQHCMSCHRTGAQGAPVRYFDDYETAKSFSSLIVRRLEAIGVPPMPPASAETLTAAQYAVVIQWVERGLQP